MEKQFSFTLTEGETNLLLKALSKLPLEESLGVFLKIKQSAEDQLKPKQEETNG